MTKRPTHCECNHRCHSHSACAKRLDECERFFYDVEGVFCDACHAGCRSTEPHRESPPRPEAPALPLLPHDCSVYSSTRVRPEGLIHASLRGTPLTPAEARAVAAHLLAAADQLEPRGEAPDPRDDFAEIEDQLVEARTGRKAADARIAELERQLAEANGARDSYVDALSGLAKEREERFVLAALTGLCAQPEMSAERAAQHAVQAARATLAELDKA